MVPTDSQDTDRRGGEAGRLRELAGLFVKLGVIAFGGPAAHIAMMEDEVVARRRWIDRQHFLDLVGATNLIPGPNSTEMTMHVGFERAGGRGLAVAGASFILPAVLITGALAWSYVRYGSTPQVAPLLAGIQPAVVGIIAGALWRLGRQAVTGPATGALAAAVVAAVLLGADEVLTLLAAAVLGMGLLVTVRPRAPGGTGEDGDDRGAGQRGESGGPRAPDGPEVPRAPDGSEGPGSREGSGPPGGSALPVLAPVGPGLAQATTTSLGTAIAGAGGVSLWKLGLFFLKVGAVLYGSGYVLVAFLEGDLVRGYGWLTEAQLLDAIAIGQFTPGPVLSTATFIGYLLAGVPGAAVATAAIFLPSFLFVLVLNPVVPRLRDWRWTAAFLDAVNAAAVGLMLAVTITLAVAALRSGIAVLVAAAAAILVTRFRVNAAWVVLGAALLGWLLGAAGAAR